MDIEMIEEPEVLGTALTVQDRAALALGSTKTEQDLKELAAKNVAIVAIVDKAGREQAHGAAMELKRARTTVEKVSKAARDDATQFSKAVIAEANRLVGIIQPEECRLLELRDFWDSEQERIKEEADRAERARVTAIHERIATIRGYLALAMECRTSERVQALLDKMVAVWLAFDLPVDFAEFCEEAQEVYNLTHQRISAIIGQKKDEELERARVKAEQEAAAASIKAEREALAAEQATAKAKADAEAAELAAARAELQRQRDQIAAERAELERTQREAREAADLAAYAAAIAEPVAPLPTLEIEPPAIEPDVEILAADVPPDDAILLAGCLHPPKQPSALKLIRVVAHHFDVSPATAAEWLTNAADEIANFE